MVKNTMKKSKRPVWSAVILAVIFTALSPAGRAVVGTASRTVPAEAGSSGQAADGNASSAAAGGTAGTDRSTAAAGTAGTDGNTSDAGSAAADSGAGTAASSREETAAPAAPAGSLKVTFCDVGEGDCALIETDGHYMIIDGGPSSASRIVYTILKNQGITHFDIMVASHSDADHIGGLSAALQLADASLVLCPVTGADTRTFQSFLRYLDRQGAAITVPACGASYTLGEAVLTVLGPVRTEGVSDNNTSLVIRLVYGSTAFLFTGDAEAEEEQDILQSGADLSAAVLKVGHHGSAGSTGSAFLSAVSPSCAVISVGADNPYGHPTQTVLGRLGTAGAEIFRTDQQGDITVVSDGTAISVTAEK